MEEIKILQIDDTSFEFQSIIQFSSLIKILYKLNEKEKSLEQKVDKINQLMIEKELRLKNLELKLDEQPKFEELKIGQSFISSANATQNIIKSEKIDFSPKKTNLINSDIEDKKDKDKEKDLNVNININEIKREENKKNETSNYIKIVDMDQNNKENNIDKEKEKKEENAKSTSFKNDDKKSSDNDSSKTNINLDLIKNLVKKSKDHEKKLLELSKKSNEHKEFFQNHKTDNELINNNSKNISNLKSTLDELLNNFSTFKTDLEDMKVKVQDFNIFDLIKSGSDNSGGNIDLTKALILNLENKVFKKFGFYDERYKSYDTDIFKIKEDNKNMNNSFSTFKTYIEKNNEEVKANLEELNTNLTNDINEIKNEISEIKNELDEIKNKNEENNNIINNQINSKIQKVEDNFKSLIQKELEQYDDNIKNILSKQSTESSSKNYGDIDSIKNITKKLITLEKEIYSKEKSINDIKDKLQSLEDDTFKKFTRFESLYSLKDKLTILEEEITNDSLKFNTLQQAYEKTRSDISNLVHKIELVNSQISKLTMQKLSSGEKPEINIDLSKYVEKDELSTNIKEINNKFEKVRLAIENLGRNIESILSTLSHTVNDKEMTNFQNSIKTSIDEIKINFVKKFADKLDTNKNLKLLDTQIKNILEKEKKDIADNWLLAKKPLNNFLCASCESVIKGELDKRSDYIAWNKYPSRDDKNYRMGHGFSKMLQLVDDSIMKNTNNDIVNNNNNNLFTNNNINTEDNNAHIKTVFNVNYLSKLPKMKPKYINTMRNTNVNLEGSLSSRDRNKDEHSSIHFDDQNDSKSPQIMKIYKKNKNQENKCSNSNSVSNIHLFNNQNKGRTDINNSNNNI